MSARIRRWFEDRDWEPLPWFATSGAEEPEWRELFSEGRPREILHRLVEGDPLGLAPMASLVVSDAALLIHPGRLLARSSARIAREAAIGYEGDPALVRWMRKWTDHSLEELVEEDVEEERMRRPMPPEEIDEIAELIPPDTGIDSRLGRLATVLFNRYPLPDRVPFYRACVEGFALEDVAHDLNEPVSAIRKRIERVTQRLVLAVNDVDERRKKR